MTNLKFGLGFILALALLLAASSFFFRDRQAPPSPDPLEMVEDPSPDPRTKAREAESIPNERAVSEQSLDGEPSGNSSEGVDGPDSNLESVFLNLNQEMAKRGYAKGLSDCIESQFRENQGVENPKDLDAMLQICDRQFNIAEPQSQQVREVVLEAIAKAQSKSDEF